MSKLKELYSQWLAIQPFKAGDQTRLDQKFMLEFNYNSNHIEGNTLTYGQTEMLLLFGKVIDEANMRDLEEMKAHNVGLKMMQTEALETRPLTEAFIRQLHQTILREDYTISRQLPDGSTMSYMIHAGQYKTRPNSVITVTGERFEYASPEETPALMADLIQWYNEEENKGELSPAELAAIFHYRYIRIHPFEDGNGRIARLLVNFILLRHNYPMIIVRSKLKDAYLKVLNKCDTSVGPVPSDGAHATPSQIEPFIEYIENLISDEITNDIKFISEKAERVWWFDGTFITFRSNNTVKILQLMTSNPDITVRELSEKLNINKSAIQKQIKTLREKEYISRVGGKKGQWHVAIVCTAPKNSAK
jgi:fic protein